MTARTWRFGVVRLRKSQLGDDAAGVLADRCPGNDQLPGDGGVEAAFGDEREDLAFAGRTGPTAVRGGLAG